MKKYFVVFFLMGSFGITANARSIMVCGQAGIAIFNSENVYECKMTKNTCETDAYLNNGWMPSANGKCPSKMDPNMMCGLGGGIMQYPGYPQYAVSSLSTCETSALMEMGWINRPSDAR